MNTHSDLLALSPNNLETHMIDSSYIANMLENLRNGDDAYYTAEAVDSALTWLRARPSLSAQAVGDDLEIAEAALQRFHDKFIERAHVDPSTGYPEYGSQEDYYIDLCDALEAVKGLQDVPVDPREQEYEP